MKNNKGFIATVTLYSTLIIIILLIFYIMYFLSMGRTTSMYILGKSKGEVDSIQPKNVVSNNNVFIDFSANIRMDDINLYEKFSDENIRYTVKESKMTTNETQKEKYTLYNLSDSNFADKNVERTQYLGIIGDSILFLRINRTNEKYDRICFYNLYNLFADDLKTIKNDAGNCSIEVSEDSSIKVDSDLEDGINEVFYYKEPEESYKAFIVQQDASTKDFSYMVSVSSIDDYKAKTTLTDQLKNKDDGDFAYNYLSYDKETTQYKFKNNAQTIYNNTCNSYYGGIDFSYEMGEYGPENKGLTVVGCHNTNPTILSKENVFKSSIGDRTIFIKESFSLDGHDVLYYSLLSVQEYNNIEITLESTATDTDLKNVDNTNKYFISYIETTPENKYTISSSSSINKDFNILIYTNSEDEAFKNEIANKLGISKSKVITKSSIYSAIDDAKTKIQNNINIKKEDHIQENSEVANEPVLAEGLIPVVYDENNDVWEVADTSDWYDYSKQIWANAVTTSSSTYRTASAGTKIPMDDINSMWVWIPRYRYTIGNKESGIDVEFSTITESAHPAFTFGGKELAGFWFAKFETGGNNKDGLLIKPNEITFTGDDKDKDKALKVSEMYSSVKKMNLGLSNVDTHMSKGIEWGAVAYLSQSEYGKYGNSNYTGDNKQVYYNNCTPFNNQGTKHIITGKSGGKPELEYDDNGTYYYNDSLNGTGASTTGTIYGVYDMNGGAKEFVMSTMYSKDYPTELSGGYPSGFNGPHPYGLRNGKDGSNEYKDGEEYPDYQYYDAYDYGHTMCFKGDATCETEEWYKLSIFASNKAWMVRNTIFEYDYDIGIADKNQSFRISLVNTN